MFTESSTNSIPEVAEENDAQEVVSDKEKDILDQISNLYIADKTPLQIMQMVADWQQDLKDED